MKEDEIYQIRVRVCVHACVHYLGLRSQHFELDGWKIKYSKFPNLSYLA